MSTTSIPLPLPTHTPPISSLLRFARIRFTLRELMLLMLTCAAFFGWAHGVRQRFQPFQPTPVETYFTSELQNEVATIRTELGEEGPAWSTESPQAGMPFPYGMEPLDNIRRSWSGDLHLPWPKAFQLCKELNSRIVDRIEHGQPILGTGSGKFLRRTGVGIPGYYEDEIHYRCGNIHGEIRICLVQRDGQPIRLMATLNEIRVP